ncbi:transcription elongation factor Elf1 [Paenibacillus shirakamiensis]|uniref:Transcription elongation factor Elf1 n=1 Tax=Paenibacillus shirakamiensis TaxID=1265935 RepID=A0ABS4JC04_9BACL|nr:hypothetical protein [Paenibacillus shirakamiensis]MBP1999257.1 transcription elongation factor Elf1 [Paenibacillus shirakamiensis]
MKNLIPEIKVQFSCPDCDEEIQVIFHNQQVEAIHCSKCNKVYSLLKPTIGEEILLDWEREALYHKIKAEKSNQDNSSLVALMIKVAELLTWRDEGHGKLKAIEALREWAMDHEDPKAISELKMIYGSKKTHNYPRRF